MSTKSINKPSNAVKTLISQKVKNFKKLKEKDLPLKKFGGTGIYALFYKGKDGLYNKDLNSPVYIGRVQTTQTSTEVEDKERPFLYTKIKEACKSIEEAKNLSLEDFKCKYMLLDETEMSLSETIETQLINHFQPAWNTCLEGFANHNPGKGRLKQAPSEWDVLHPGRPWAKKLQGKAKDRRAIKKKVENHLQKYLG
jgi:hypothetical protein